MRSSMATSCKVSMIQAATSAMRIVATGISHLGRPDTSASRRTRERRHPKRVVFPATYVALSSRLTFACISRCPDESRELPVPHTAPDSSISTGYMDAHRFLLPLTWGEFFSKAPPLFGSPAPSSLRRPVALRTPASRRGCLCRSAPRRCASVSQSLHEARLPTSKIAWMEGSAVSGRELWKPL